jgi:integration host factor subunit beta
MSTKHERATVRSEICESILAANPQLGSATVGAIVDTVLERIVGALAEGRRVELRDFGVFSTREREGRIARNPRDGSDVTVPPKRAVHFKPGRALAARLANAMRGAPTGTSVQ